MPASVMNSTVTSLCLIKRKSSWISSLNASLTCVNDTLRDGCGRPFLLHISHAADTCDISSSKFLSKIPASSHNSRSSVGCACVYLWTRLQNAIGALLAVVCMFPSRVPTVARRCGATSIRTEFAVVRHQVGKYGSRLVIGGSAYLNVFLECEVERVSMFTYVHAEDQGG